jgi:paraquat-inducible protein B
MLKLKRMMLMDDVPSPELNAIPQALPGSRRRISPSLVWLIPLLAALIGGWLVANAVLSRGPLITIQLSSGEGLTAGKTHIKYKDVEIGDVVSVKLSPDRKHILVQARMDKDAAPLLVADSRFWVVRPRISGGTVSGLGTLIEGAYIGIDVGRSTQLRDHFVALDEPPVISGDRPGRQFRLLANDLGSLAVGSPVYYHRVPVGQVTGYRLTQDGHNVAVSVFVNRPYDAFVTASSRFWHASGLDITVDANGLKVDAQSLVSLALGGIAFDSSDPEGSAPPPAAGQQFLLASDRVSAMRQLEPDAQTFLLTFRESLRGLSVGAPVDYRGLTIGEVTAIGVDARSKSNAPNLLMSARIRVYPRRLMALVGDRTVHANLDQVTLPGLLARGFRAQLRSANLLTGQLYVALDYFPHAPKAGISMNRDIIVLPTVPGDMSELQRTLGNIVKQVDKMHLDTLSADVHQSVQRLNSVLQRTDTMVDGVNNRVLPQAMETLQTLQQTLNNARQTLAPDSALQQDLRDAAQQVSAAARSVQSLSDSLDRHPEALVRGKPGDKK